MQQYIFPRGVLTVLNTLQAHGHRAYLVGGCVRDLLRGVEPHDWDICTSALPSETAACFEKTINVGVKHGTITVLTDGLFIEVTTFRAEGSYSDHRHPDEVRFVSTLETDLKRRDFTVNALAMDATGVVTDLFGGQDDLNARILRTVGEGEKRFAEDALRMLRAVRFSAQLGFTIEEKTAEALRLCAPMADHVAPERTATEIQKLLCSDRPERMRLLPQYALLSNPLPLTEDMPFWKLGCVSNHPLDRWMALTLLLNSAAPAETFRLDKRTVRLCRMCLELSKLSLRSAYLWKKWISEAGMDDAVVLSRVLSAWYGTDDESIVLDIQKRGACCTLAQLAVTGSDLLAIGYHGKQIGEALSKLLSHVWEKPEDNKRDVLLALLKKEKPHG